jgi:hypothetical protein
MRCIVVDPFHDDLLWIGGLRGLVSFNKNTTTFQHHETPFKPVGEIGHLHSQYLVTDVLFLDSLRIAAATWAGGVLIYDTHADTWLRHTDPSLLPDENIYYTLKVKDDNSLWVCSFRGFGILHTETGSYTYYDSIPGKVKYNNSGWGASAMRFLNDRDFIVLGYLGGIVGHFADEEVSEIPLHPPLVRSVLVDERLLPPVNNFYPHRQVSMATAQDDLSFQILSPMAFQPDSVTYRYQLIGHDKTWQTHTGVKQIKNHDLKGGKYQLQ